MCFPEWQGDSKKHTHTFMILNSLLPEVTVCIRVVYHGNQIAVLALVISFPTAH